MKGRQSVRSLVPIPFHEGKTTLCNPAATWMYAMLKSLYSPALGFVPSPSLLVFGVWDLQKIIQPFTPEYEGAVHFAFVVNLSSPDKPMQTWDRSETESRRLRLLKTTRATFC